MLGSGILAIPGSAGTYFLLYAAIDSLNGRFDELALLFPVALIGYCLLFGYFWTNWTKRFVKWFWIISMIYNLFITLAGGIYIFNWASAIFYLPNNKSDVLIGLLLMLFPIWTLFVTIASAKYAFYKPTDKDLNLP